MSLAVSQCSRVHTHGRKVVCPRLFHSTLRYIIIKDGVSVTVSQCSEVHIQGRKVVDHWWFYRVVGYQGSQVECLCVICCTYSIVGYTSKVRRL